MKMNDCIKIYKVVAVFLTTAFDLIIGLKGTFALKLDSQHIFSLFDIKNPSFFFSFNNLVNFLSFSSNFKP